MKSYMIINTINALYEQLAIYNPKLKNNEGLLFKVTIVSEYLGFEDDGNTRHPEWEGVCIQPVWCMLLKNHKVFINIQKEHNPFDDIPQANWKNTSNHDSCWRDGLRDITHIGFNCWDEAHKNCPKKYRPSTKDEGTRFSIGFCCLGSIIKVVEAELENYSENSYHYVVKSVKESKKKIDII